MGNLKTNDFFDDVEQGIRRTDPFQRFEEKNNGTPQSSLSRDGVTIGFDEERMEGKRLIPRNMVLGFDKERLSNRIPVPKPKSRGTFFRTYYPFSLSFQAVPTFPKSTTLAGTFCLPGHYDSDTGKPPKGSLSYSVNYNHQGIATEVLGYETGNNGDYGTPQIIRLNTKTALSQSYKDHFSVYSSTIPGNLIIRVTDKETHRKRPVNLAEAPKNLDQDGVESMVKIFQATALRMLEHLKS